MAEENDNTEVKCKINIGIEHDSTDNSVGKPGAANKGNDAVPHYLRASTGSCHDACKYGKPHEFKDKPWRPMRRRVSAPLPNGEKIVGVHIYVDKKVKNAMQLNKTKPSPAKESSLANERIKKNSPPPRKSPVHESLKLSKQEARSHKKSLSSEVSKATKKEAQYPGKTCSSDTSKSIKREAVPAAKKDVSAKGASLNPSKPNVRTVKSSSSSNSSTGSGGKQTSETKTVANPRTSRVAAVRKVPSPPSVISTTKRSSTAEAKKILSSNSGAKVVSSNVRKTKSPKDQGQKSQAPAENQIALEKAESKESVDDNVEERTLHVIDTKEDCLSSDQVKSADCFPAGQNGSQLITCPPLPTESLRIYTREDCFSAADRGTQVIQPPSPLSIESLNSSSQMDSPSFTSRVVDDRGELHSEYTDGETDNSISEYCGSYNEKQINSLKEEKGQNCSGGTRDSGDKDSQDMKLRFRRGRVVELQGETDSPRRLQFRQGRVLAGNQGTNSEPRRKTYRSRAIRSDKKESETGPVKVVLKHQDVETKKDEQILLNNVIEQTANKLVETRKSKVKALVGAFETVISLQERKPSTANR